MQLTDATIVVTGAARGIGRAIVEELRVAGAFVGALDLLPMREEEGILPIVCDVRDAAAVDAAVARIAAWRGRIDGVVNNAGILRDGALVKLGKGGIQALDLESWNDTLQTNLTGTFHVARAAVPVMITSKAKGAVVNVSSISRQGNAGQGAYAASKAAVSAVTRTWAEELAFFKIRCVAIAPGLIDTPMMQGIPKDRLDRYRPRIPAGKVGEPSAIARMVRSVFENDYVNGTTIEVDGGFRF